MLRVPFKEYLPDKPRVARLVAQLTIVHQSDSPGGYGNYQCEMRRERKPGEAGPPGQPEYFELIGFKRTRGEMELVREALAVYNRKFGKRDQLFTAKGKKLLHYTG